MEIVFLSIGTNLGNRQRNLDKAVSGIKEFIGPVIKSSSVYETEPWGFSTSHEFLNMVMKVETMLDPIVLLGVIHKIETLLGRIRNEDKYISRLIDIDILIYGNQVINEKDIKIPHPLMHERRFVLVPMCELEPDMLHPRLKMSYASLLMSCSDKCKVKLFRQQDNFS